MQSSLSGEERMFEGVLARDTLLWDPVEHFFDQVCRSINVLFFISFARQHLSECLFGHFINLVHQVNFMLVDLAWYFFQFFLRWQTQHSNLLNQLAAFSLAWEQGSLGHEFSENTPDCYKVINSKELTPNVNFDVVVWAAQDQFWRTVITTNDVGCV